MSRLVYVGVDGGGSTTECLLAGEDGTLLGVGRGGASNIHFAGREAALHSLKEAIQGAGLLPDDVVLWAYLGMAGAMPSGENTAFIEIAQQAIPQAAQITVTSDAEVALAGALELRPGICVNSGTGAFGIGKNKHGKMAFTSGLGPILGDEGSGYWIGMQGMRAALRYHDHRGEQTILLERLLAALGVNAPSRAALLVYAQDDPRKLLSELCPIVLDCAEEGDHVALKIVQEAGAELALAARAIALQLDLLDKPVEVAPLGSVLTKGELLRRSFSDALSDMLPLARVVAPRHPPSVGSVLLAMQRSGRSLSQDQIARLTITPNDAYF